MAEEINEGLPNPYDAEKRLMRAFTEAVELGADKQVLAQILNEWQAEHIQINKLQMSLFTPKDDLGKESDPMMEYARASKKNLSQSMGDLVDNVKKQTEKAKNGTIKSGSYLTKSIQYAHDKVKSLYHEKGRDLAVKLKGALEKFKDNLRDRSQISKLNRWEKAIVNYENAKAKSDINKEDYIAKAASKIGAQTQKQLDKNSEKFQKAISNSGEPSLRERMKIGLKTFSDALLRKDYKEYKADKTTEEAAKDMLKAKENLEKSNSRSMLLGKMKLEFVKAWTNLTIAFNGFKQKQYEKTANKLRDELTHSDNNKAKDLMSRIDEAKANGMSEMEAVRFVAEQNRKAQAPTGQTDKNPDITPDKGGDKGPEEKPKAPTHDFGR